MIESKANRYVDNRPWICRNLETALSAATLALAMIVGLFIGTSA